MSEREARPSGLWWLYCGAWLLYLSMYATAFAAFGEPLLRAARGAIANVLPDALLGVLLLRIPRWVPWRDHQRVGFFAVHGTAFAGFVTLATAGWLALWALDRRIFEGAWNLRFDFRALPWRVLTELLVYATLVGLAYAQQNAAARRELEARAARAEALRAKAELEALRSQLNPHFILNTFHALIGLVRRDPARAEEALERLGDLLRHSLRVQRDGIDEVPLREEWAFVRAYLELEGLRLGERLRPIFDVCDEALDVPLPSFALQTLVENAVRHGIARQAAGGRLTVSARLFDGALRIVVENDVAAGAESPGSGGIGLRLLEDRLAALYGGSARLRLEGDASRFRATLDVPLPEEQEP